MTSAVLTSADSFDGLRRYLTDVGNAARALLEALVAAPNRAFVARKVAQKRVARPQVSNRLSALMMANDYHHMHPQLAAKLRELARG
jgi:hypothetical protein